MAFSHIRQLIKSKFQWWINVAPADAPERLPLLSINVLPERLCPAGMYDIMRSIRRPSWVTRPPIAQSQFFFDGGGVDGQFIPTRVFEWMPSWHSGNNPFSLGGCFFGPFPKTYCKYAFVRPSCACSYILKSLLKGYLTELLRVKHKDDLSSRCSNEVRMACHENDSRQSGMWKAVMATNGYDIVKIPAHCHTPLCEWVEFWAESLWTFHGCKELHATVNSCSHGNQGKKDNRRKSIRCLHNAFVVSFKCVGDATV